MQHWHGQVVENTWYFAPLNTMHNPQPPAYSSSFDAENHCTQFNHRHIQPGTITRTEHYRKWTFTLPVFLPVDLWSSFTSHPHYTTPGMQFIRCKWISYRGLHTDRHTSRRCIIKIMKNFYREHFESVLIYKGYRSAKVQRVCNKEWLLDRAL